LERFSSKPTLFFDFDGPLIDVSSRYITLHQDLLREHGQRGMGPALYWQRKRARSSEEAILEELGLADLAPRYVPIRLARIESLRYLTLDRAWDWTFPILRDLSECHHLVLVTARAQRELLVHQLEQLQLHCFFDDVLSQPAGIHVHEQKAALIRNHLSRHQLSPGGHWMIGDTEADVAAGRLVGLSTVAVLCGIRDREHLVESAPDYVLGDIRELPLVLGEKSCQQLDSGGLDEHDRFQCRTDG
jgi:phosphoglycolate phosphatase-like HAD superfamily hydrolase